MCHVNFYCISSALHRANCCITISFYESIHFFCRYCFRNVLSICRCDCCCSLDRCSCILCITFRSCILKLDRNLCAFCVTGICNSLQAFNTVIIIQARFLRASLSTFMYYSCFNRNQTKLSFCTFTVICNGLITPCSI